MEILYSIIFGIIQGITEFLPVSSSGHLIILHNILSFNLVSDIAFDVALHAGTFLALLIFFGKDIINYCRHQQRFMAIIIVAAVPAGIAGLFLEDIIDLYLRNIWIIVATLIIVGVLFILIEKRVSTEKTMIDINVKSALKIGFFQILALIPGTSRSGITIYAGMASGLKREQAARFSFLIGLPIFAGATLKKSWDLSQIGIAPEQWLYIAVGIITSFVVGIISIKFLLKFLEKYSLRAFAYYRFALAVVLIIYLLIK
ncbi:MAG: undecaprenyl-diphosphate phosphatase [Patescibacteria group bacterium]